MAERLVFISSFLCVISLSMVANAAVPAVFIFGDSTADVGTNNYIKDSKAKANFPQNGIDFPGSIPTGRFSNGLNTADFLAQQMGFRRSPPPFYTLMKEKLRLHKHVLRGVNFASGGSGLMDVTGIAPYGKVLPMSKQIQQFATVHNIIKESWGEEATDSILSRSPFFISVGSNDLFEYFALNNGTSNKHEYITILKSAYEKHLRVLYLLGARKFGIVSVPPLGCCPSYRIFNNTSIGGCLEGLNEYSRLFFLSIDALLQQLSCELKDMKYSLGNTYDVVSVILNNPPPNIKEVRSACCGSGKFNGEDTCSQSAKLCSNRDEYLFWDLYHPTQAAAKLAARTLYEGGPEFVTPINFKELAEAH